MELHFHRYSKANACRHHTEVTVSRKLLSTHGVAVIFKVAGPWVYLSLKIPCRLCFPGQVQTKQFWQYYNSVYRKSQSPMRIHFLSRQSRSGFWQWLTFRFTTQVLYIKLEPWQNLLELCEKKLRIDLSGVWILTTVLFSVLPLPPRHIDSPQIAHQPWLCNPCLIGSQFQRDFLM